MNNTYKLPRHISHIASRYVIAAIIGSPFVTACNSSRCGINNENEPDEPMEMHASTNDVVKPVDEQPVDTSMAIASPSDAQHGNRAIHLAVFNNDLDEVQKLVAEDSGVLGEVNGYGNTLIHIIACLDYTKMMKWIIEWIQTHPDSRDLLNITNAHGHTPAHQAARKGHKDIYNLLVAAGANLTIKCNKHNMTPEEEYNHFGQSK
ncbi:ankyrin repeat domain-containing protein [Cardinium endosymbiont of Sogatella furcifera]|uniref:ankyrin repeat domain-containing protein n=1 Tax=Cardinium endosymbiont of Sogatella furcifera TaxID=650378 RepID=UPI0013B396A6|nr:ankyrin repeat domain-containing protein [Cardinium endosymbiont of Sogatella furcifera]